MLGLHILFAVDDVMSQWIMADVLSGSGYTVTSVCRGTQVIDLLNDAPDYDLLVADTTLLDSSPKAEFVDVWRRILSGRPIIYTGLHRAAWQHALPRNECFVRTPYSTRTLLQTVDRAIGKAAFTPFGKPPNRVVHQIH